MSPRQISVWIISASTFCPNTLLNYVFFFSWKILTLLAAKSADSHDGVIFIVRHRLESTDKHNDSLTNEKLMFPGSFMQMSQEFYNLVQDSKFELTCSNNNYEKFGLTKSYIYSKCNGAPSYMVKTRKQLNYKVSRWNWKKGRLQQVWTSSGTKFESYGFAHESARWTDLTYTADSV